MFSFFSSCLSFINRSLSPFGSCLTFVDASSRSLVHVCHYFIQVCHFLVNVCLSFLFVHSLMRVFLSCLVCSLVDVYDSLLQ